MVSIEVTQAEWDSRGDEFGGDVIINRAHAAVELDWECYSSFIDDELMYVFFVKNDLVEINEGNVVAAWEADDSMVVGVEISLI